MEEVYKIIVEIELHHVKYEQLIQKGTFIEFKGLYVSSIGLMTCYICNVEFMDKMTLFYKLELSFPTDESLTELNEDSIIYLFKGFTEIAKGNVTKNIGWI